MIERQGGKLPKGKLPDDASSEVVESFEKARLRRELKRLVDFFKTHSPYGKPISESERYDKALADQKLVETEDRPKEEDKKENPEGTPSGEEGEK